MVFCCTPDVSSWDALDDHWLSQIDRGTPTDHLCTEARGRRRLFYRYFHFGHGPEKLRGLNGQYLIDVVHRDPRQSEAKALFNSPLWELTARVAPSLDRVREIHSDLMRRLGLVCLTPTQRVLARISGFENVALDNRDLRNIAESAYNIGARVSADAIALLACSFKLALDALSLREADAYLDALRWSLRRFAQRWGPNKVAGSAFTTLIEARLLRRRNNTVSPEMLGFHVRKDRRRDSLSSADSTWPYHSILTNRGATFTPPMVPIDDCMHGFLQGFAKNHAALRDQIVHRLALEDAIDNGMDPGVARTLHQERTALVDSALHALNSHSEAAEEMLRLNALAHLLGGLPKILHELFQPDDEHETVSPCG